MDKHIHHTNLHNNQHPHKQLGHNKGSTRKTQEAIPNYENVFLIFFSPLSIYQIDGVSGLFFFKITNPSSVGLSGV